MTCDVYAVHAVRADVYVEGAPRVFASLLFPFRIYSSTH